ncbi:methyltransferase domain-containing protein [Candidatus Woesearchaeota archaeon]|nr:methyltransferase domain-containing protein [Candidatus Woesearchaeota archaeon]
MKKHTLKNLLKSKLTKKQLEKLPNAYDIIGDILIIDLDPALKPKEKLISQTLSSLHPNIKTVCKKQDIHKGKFRTQKLKIIAGEKRKETIHKENNIRLKLNIETCYFSPRSGNERKRIANQVKKGENILVMFSGIAPLPVTIAKNTKAKHITAIELNPKAHKYAEENLKLNKIDNVELIQGDVKKIKLKNKFDRILMPLPKTGEEFLPLALSHAKKGSIIHYYSFLKEDEFKKEKNKIKNICKNSKKNCKILRIIKCGHYKPYVFRVCSDIKIL